MGVKVTGADLTVIERIVGGIDGTASAYAERPVGGRFIDIAGRDLGGYVAEARDVVAREGILPPGYSIAWSGQSEYIERVRARLILVVSATLAIITLMMDGADIADGIKPGDKGIMMLGKDGEGLYAIGGLAPMH